MPLGEISELEISLAPIQRVPKASIVACAGVVGYGVSVAVADNKVGVGVCDTEIKVGVL